MISHQIKKINSLTNLTKKRNDYKMHDTSIKDKTKIILCLTTSLLLSACSQTTTVYKDEYERLLEAYDSLETKYDDAIQDYEKEIHYYEALCDENGYLTYDMLYHPDVWRVYASDNTLHLNWLCEQLDKKSQYICTTFENVKYSENLTWCDICGRDINVAYYFLDEKTDIFHDASARDCFDFSIDDYTHKNVNYRFVYYDSAINAGYIPCPECLTN